jgi:hypothetical protein
MAQLLWKDAHAYFRLGRLVLDEPRSAGVFLANTINGVHSFNEREDERRRSAGLGPLPPGVVQPASIAIRFKPEVISAAPHRGGFGILGPGQYTYDRHIWVSPSRFQRTKQYWLGRRQRYVGVMQASPGVRDLEAAMAASVEADTRGDVIPTAEHATRYRQRWADARTDKDGVGLARQYGNCAKMAGAVRRWHRRKYVEPPWCGRYATEHVLDAARALSYALDDAKDTLLGKITVKKRLELVDVPPGLGILSRLWHGYAEVIVPASEESADASELRERMALVTRGGREFLKRYSWLPRRVRDMYLHDEIGPVGAAGRILPASWAPLLRHGVVRAFLYVVAHERAVARSRHQILLCLEDLTLQVARCLWNSLPGLMLH